MVVGPLLRAVAPKLMGAVAEKGLHYAAGRAIGAGAARGLASPTGQRLVSRVGGERAASFVASKGGRRVVSMGVGHDVRKGLKGEDEAPTPVATPAMPTTPVSEDFNPNLMASDTPLGRRQRQQGWQDNGTMGSRFGGPGGGGWWTAQSIMNPMEAGYDWRTLDSTSVARGPAEWNMAGKGLVGRTRRRANEFADGYSRGVNGPSSEPVSSEPEPVDVYGGADPFATSAPTPPRSRTDAFNQGTLF